MSVLTNRIRKGATLSLLIFTLFLSCSKPGPSWEYDETVTQQEHFNSGRMIFQPKLAATGLKVELTRGACGEKLYLNSLCRNLPVDKSDGSKTRVKMFVENQPFIVLADRLEGGQRLLLPDDFRRIFIDALSAGKSIRIEVASLKTDVVACNFESMFERLNQIPIESCEE